MEEFYPKYKRSSANDDINSVSTLDTIRDFFRLRWCADMGCAREEMEDSLKTTTGEGVDIHRPIATGVSSPDWFVEGCRTYTIDSMAAELKRIENNLALTNQRKR